jgi:hypothetical protein
MVRTNLTDVFEPASVLSRLTEGDVNFITQGKCIVRVVDVVDVVVVVVGIHRVAEIIAQSNRHGESDEREEEQL